MPELSFEAFTGTPAPTELSWDEWNKIDPLTPERKQNWALREAYDRTSEQLPAEVAQELPTINGQTMLSGLDRDSNRQKFKGMFERNYARLLGGDPDAAAKRAQEAFERGLNFEDNLPIPILRSVIGGVASNYDRFAGRFARLTGSGEAADELTRRANMIGEATRVSNQNSSLPQWLLRGVEGASSSIAAAAGTPGGLPAVIGGFAVDAYNQASVKGQDSGLKGWELQRYAIEQGATEGLVTAIFQKIGLGGFEKEMASRAVQRGFKEAFKRIPKVIAQELPEELTIGGLQAVSDKLEGVDPKALDWKNIQQLVADVFVQTIMVGSAAPMARASLDNFVRDPSPENAKALGLPELPADQRTELAKAFGEVVTHDATGQATPEQVSSETAAPQVPQPGAAQGASQSELEQLASSYGLSGVEGRSPEQLERWVGVAEQATQPLLQGTQAQADTYPGPAPSVAADTQPQAVEPNFEGMDRTKVAEVAKLWGIERIKGKSKRVLEQLIRERVIQSRKVAPTTQSTEVAAGEALPEQVTTEVAAAPQLPAKPPAGKLVEPPSPEELIATRPEIAKALAAKATAGTPITRQDYRRAGFKSVNGSQETRNAYAKALEQLLTQPQETPNEVRQSNGESLPEGQSQIPSVQQEAPQNTAKQVPILDETTPPASQAVEAEVQEQAAPPPQPTNGQAKLPPGLENATSEELHGLLKSMGVNLRGRKLDHGQLVNEVHRMFAGTAKHKPARSFSVDPNAEKGVGRINVDTTAVQELIPGAEVTQNGPSSWRVSHKNGWYVDIAAVPNIKPKPEARKQLEAIYGDKYTPEQYDALEGEGYYEAVTRDGQRVPIGSLIALSEATGADKSVLKHEVLHLAKSMGFFQEGEWDALAKKYAPGVSNEKQVEEAIAAGLQKKGAANNGLFKRIQDFIRKFLKSIGWGKENADDIARKMQSPEFWNREPGGEVSDDGMFSLAPSMFSLTSKDPEVKRKLANIALTQRERDFLEELDRAATEAGEPAVRADKEVFEKAAQLLATDRAGERANVLRAASQGGQLNDVETVVAKQLFQDEAYAALESEDETKIAEVAKLRDAYRGTGTEQARAFRQRRDPLNGKSIIEATKDERQAAIVDEIFKRPEKEEKEYQKAQRNGDTAALEKLNKQLAKRLQKVDRYLNSIGLSLHDLPQIAEDPLATARVRKQVAASKTGAADKLYEYWQNLGLLSGPATQAVNIAGNAASGIYDFGIQRQIEALTNIGTWDKSGAQVGEIPYIWKGLGRGIQEGMRNAILTWKTETPVTQRDKWDQANVAIGGKAGRIVRAFGWRPLQVADEFFNSLFANLQVGAVAYRQATVRKLEGDALTEFIDAEIANRDSLSWRMARNHAAELTMQQETEGLAKTIKGVGLKIKKDVPLARWIIPFVTFPVNSAATALRKAPITGDLAMAKKAYNNWKQGKPPTLGMNRYFAERMIAWGATMALMSTVDPDDPWITGGKTNPQGTPKNSIKIGGKWYEYGRIEPFATALSLMVDGMMTVKGGSTEQIAGATVDLPASQLADKTFLRGLSDAMTVLGLGGDPAAKEDAVVRWSRYGARFGESFIPNVYRQTVEATRPNLDEFRVWGTTPGEKLKRTAERLGEGAEVSEQENRYDPWGRPVQKSHAPFWSAPSTDFIYRLLTPVRNTPDNVTLGDKLIARWNALNPDEAKSLDRPMPYFTYQGKKHSMTGEEYEQFQREAGQTADAIVNRLLRDKDAPTAADMKKLDKAIEDGRAKARAKLLPHWRKRILGK